jgi:hypothetical protein
MRDVREKDRMIRSSDASLALPEANNVNPLDYLVR